MFRECPYRPAGLGPAGTALDHCRVAEIISSSWFPSDLEPTSIQKVQRLIQNI